MIKTQNTILQRFAKDFYLERVFPALHERRLQQFVTLALTLFAISFFGFFALSPTLATIADLQKQLQDNQFADEKLQEKIANLSTLEQKYNTLQNDLPGIFAAVPSTPQVSLLLGQLYAIAHADHLTVTKMETTSLQLAPIPTNGKLDRSVDFTISIQGSKENLFSFLADISRFERIITIDTLLINKQAKTSENSSSENLLLDIKGKAHFKLS